MGCSIIVMALCWHYFLSMWVVFPRYWWRVTLRTPSLRCLLVPLLVGGSSFISMEIKVLSPLVEVDFNHVGRSANGFADSLAKGWIDHLCMSLFLCSFGFFSVMLPCL